MFEDKNVTKSKKKIENKEKLKSPNLLKKIENNEYVSFMNTILFHFYCLNFGFY